MNDGAYIPASERDRMTWTADERRLNASHAVLDSVARELAEALRIYGQHAPECNMKDVGCNLCDVQSRYDALTTKEDLDV